MVQKRHSIGEVEELTGIPRRTLHFYVQIGLVPRPMGGGRGHYYTNEHLQRLSLIKDLQSRGHSLKEIGQHLSTGNTLPTHAPLHGRRRSQSRFPITQAVPGLSDPRTAPVWTHLEVDDGVELHIRGGLRALTPAHIEMLRQAVRQALDTADTRFPGDRREHSHDHDPEEA